MSKQPTTAELLERIETEGRRMHHNATLSGVRLDFANEYEEHLFWDVLGDSVADWCDDLSGWIEEVTGFRLKFYSYGRNGATIAPDDWLNPAPGGDFGGVSFDKMGVGGYAEGDALERYNHTRRVLRALMMINKYWQAQAKDMPRWWSEMKEANDWQADIDAHEGKTLRDIPTWVPVAAQ